MLLLFLACSDYNLTTTIDKTGGEGPGFEDNSVQPEAGIDSDSDSEDDNDSATTEPTEADFCTFDDFTQWSYFGDGNWHIDGDLLRESQGGYYATGAYLNIDFGQSVHYSMRLTSAGQAISMTSQCRVGL